MGITRSVEISAPEDFARTAADVLIREMLAAFGEGGAVSLCLAGGSTPRAVYGRLVATAESRIPPLPWDSVHVWFGDERWVDPSDPASNYRMAREALIDPAGLDERQVHRMPVGDGEPEAAAARYEEDLPARFDVLILGIGEDGHTASLFPHSSAMREREHRVVPARSPVPPHSRLTITPPVIEGADRVVVLAAGANKAEAVAAAIEGDVTVEQCPARLARDGIWVLDTAAAAQLKA
ncbi:MAG: 6-phosphogluconolactonase [Gemmatimonadota bacterium]